LEKGKIADERWIVRNYYRPRLILNTHGIPVSVSEAEFCGKLHKSLPEIKIPPSESRWGVFS